MHFTTISLAALASTTIAQTLKTTQEFYLKTQLKNQPARNRHHRFNPKQRFANLYLSTYHTGAGMNDAVVTNITNEYSPKAFLNATNVAGFDGLLFELQGNAFPWSLVLPVTQTYAGWQPVQINAGGNTGVLQPGTGAFFVNATGLQYNTAPGGNAASNEFEGWLVCDWWHNAPQLFWRYHYEFPAPAGCADTNLIPEYI